MRSSLISLHDQTNFIKFTYVNPNAKPLWMKIHYESLYYFGALRNDGDGNTTIMSETTRASCVCENVGCKRVEGRDQRVCLRARPSTRFCTNRCIEQHDDCGEIESVRAKRRLETLEISWVRNTELSAHSAKTIQDNKGDGRKLIPNSESVDAT